MTQILRFVEQKVVWKNNTGNDVLDGCTKEYLQLLVMELLSDSGLKLKTRSLVGISFPNTFSGNELVEWLEQHELLTNAQAMKLAQKLLDAHLISHSSTDLLPFTRACWYTFSPNAQAMWYNNLSM